jgi:aryl-phospho-beta-D-glucosidase BglC (GH1 family)
MRRRIALLAIVGLAVPVGGVALAAGPAEAAAGCTVAYTVQSQWSGGFGAALAVTNLGDPVTSWSLQWTFPDPNQKVTQGWNGTFTQSGTTVTVTNMSWNGNLGTGATVNPGFNGAWSGANPVPTSFTLNGVACNGTVTSPSPSPTSSSGGGGGGPAPALHVSGNHLVTAAGTTYRLLGVNRSSGEFACIQGNGMWDGPADQASITAMKAWNIHVVRIPLNEECWLGTSDVPATGTSGAAYQQAVKDYVNLLVANGMNVILDLHWTYGQYTGPGAGCSDVKASCQKPMPDTQYTPMFWTQVATAFKGANAVIFDLFNEPYPDAANNFTDATEAWTCLRDGGTCTGISYPVAGMQALVNTVRATGATNVIMTGGLTWTNDLTQWLTYKPTDPTGNLVASWHSYNFNGCVSTACWDSQIGAVAAKVPVQAGEIGQNSCAHDYIDQVMDWADAHGVGYSAWTWNPWGVCGSSGNVLINDWNGTPTSTYGEGYKAHLLTQNP